jgi:glycosyltransferase involved in cell wall biosynthesis
VNISLVIPSIDYHDITHKALSYAQKYADEDIEYIVIDNGSSVPYELNSEYRIIRNEENIGGPNTIKQALEYANGDIVVIMHNDVLIHEQGWDTKIKDAFERDSKLVIAGFFGAMGIGENGGRIAPMSNMLGKEVGSNWSHHSNHVTDVAAATVLDGLCLIFRKEAWKNIKVPDMAIHHFYDKILPLCAIFSGYHCAVIGVAHDHGLPVGEHSTANASTIYHESARKWAQEHNIDIVDNNPDLTMYKVNERVLFHYFRKHFPMIVRDISDGETIEYKYFVNVTF